MNGLVRWMYEVFLGGYEVAWNGTEFRWRRNGNWCARLKGGGGDYYTKQYAFVGKYLRAR